MKNVLLSILIFAPLVAGKLVGGRSLRFRKEDMDAPDEVPITSGGKEDNNNHAEKSGAFGEAMELFKIKHDVKKDATLKLHMIGETNTITVDGQTYALDDVEPINVYSDDATYTVDGEEMVLPSASEPLTFVRTEGGNTVMITKDADGAVRTVDIMGQDGSDKYMAAVMPGVLASITPEELDENILKKFASGAMAHDEAATTATPPHARKLGKVLVHSHPHNDTYLDGQVERSLQSGCSSLRVIEVAAAFDSTFCAIERGETNVRREIERIVAMASVMYQAQGVCVGIQISHLEGFCSASQDPYRAGINLGSIGCTPRVRGLLQVFRDFWRNSRQSVRRDAAHLFYGTDLSGRTVGCAYVGTLCDVDAAGVNEMSFTGDEKRRAIVFAHELGHNIGLGHAESSNGNRFIMDSVGFGDHIWSPQSISALRSLIPSHSCISTRTISGPPQTPPSTFNRFQNRLPGNLCMDLVRSQTHNGNDIVLWSCHGGANQQWEFDNEGRIRSKVNRNKCVEAGRSGGLYDKLFIYDCHSGNHQKWTRHGNRRIMNKQHGYYIGVAYCRNENGRQLELRHYEDGTCGTAQTWNW